MALLISSRSQSTVRLSLWPIQIWRSSFDENPVPAPDDRPQREYHALLRAPSCKPKVRIIGEPGTAEFTAAYHAAIAGDRAPSIERPRLTEFAAKSFGRAIMDYSTSTVSVSRAEPGQRSRRLILNKLAETQGHQPLAAITKGVIQKGMDRRAKTLSAANEFLKAIRAVFDHRTRHSCDQNYPLPWPSYSHQNRRVPRMDAERGFNLRRSSWRRFEARPGACVAAVYRTAPRRCSANGSAAN